MADNVPTILVPIDLHGINRSTLETLVRIAHLLDRGLHGLLLKICACNVSRTCRLPRKLPLAMLASAICCAITSACATARWEAIRAN